MPPLRDSHFLLPVGQFAPNDLVIEIDPPQPRISNKNSPTAGRPSQHTHKDRFARHRSYLLDTYGHDKIKFRGYDDFMGVDSDQLLVGDVYGWYEVSEWPGAEQQFKKTEASLARLMLRASSSGSSSTEFDDEDKDQTYEPHDLPDLPSDAWDALTADEDTESAVLHSSPSIPPSLTLGLQSPELDLSNSLQAHERHVQDNEPNNTNMNQSKAQSGIVQHSLPSSSVTAPAPRRDSYPADEVLARLDEARAIQIQSGVISPVSKRTYTYKERAEMRKALTMDPSLFEFDDVPQNTEPRYRTQRNSKKRKASDPATSEEDVHVQSKKVRQGPTLSVTSHSVASQTQVVVQNQAAAVVSTEPAIIRGNVYPKSADASEMLKTWPQFDTSLVLLPVSHRARVRFVPSADVRLPSFKQEQNQELRVLLKELSTKLTYYHLATVEGRELAAEKGFNAVVARTNDNIIKVLTAFEKRSSEIFRSLNVKVTLDAYDCCPHLPGSGNPNTSNTQHNHGVPLPAPAGSAERPVTMPSLVAKHFAILVETVRLQTSIPPSMRGRQTGASTADRKQYEGNVRLAALGWQTHYFESWLRNAAGRLEKLVQDGGGESTWTNEKGTVIELLTGRTQNGAEYVLPTLLPEIVNADEESDEEEPEGSIQRALRQAKEIANVEETPVRTSGAHARLGAFMGVMSSDDNLQAHHSLQNELRSQHNGMQGKKGRKRGYSQVQGQQHTDSFNGSRYAVPRAGSHYMQQALPRDTTSQYNGQNVSTQSDLGSASASGHGPQMPNKQDIHSSGPVLPQAHPQAHKRARQQDRSTTSDNLAGETGSIPLDPRLFDVYQASHVTGDINNTTRSGNTDDVFGPNLSPPLTTGALMTSPGGTANVRFNSNPLPSDPNTGTVQRGSSAGIPICVDDAEDASRYTPSEDVYQRREDNVGRRDSFAPMASVAHDLFQTGAQFQSRAQSFLELGTEGLAAYDALSAVGAYTYDTGSASTAQHVQSTYPTDNFNHPNVFRNSNIYEAAPWQPTFWPATAERLNGDFGATGLGVTGETVQQAGMRGIDDGFADWRRNLS